MKGSSRALSLVLLAASLSACNGQYRLEWPGEGPPARAGTTSEVDRLILTGTWTDRTRWLELAKEGAFSWREPNTCQYPPCATRRHGGRWEAAGGLLHLTLGEPARTITLSYELTSDPQRLLLSRDTTSDRWTLQRL